MKTVYRALILIVMAILRNMPLAQATTYTVTSLGDNGAGTLRQAIINANADAAAPHRIVFTVTGSIDITSGTLPNILRQTTIDGGTLGNVVINGNNSADFGLFFADASAANSVVKNLVINNYKNTGVVITGGVTNITVDNCRIGTNVS
ncbi:MAG: hypothetical protein K2Q22_12910 [Cytophagales bacterium]|nr:hypothetical protein [Cytophagales bacterium]